MEKTVEKMTALQWAAKGCVPNSGARGMEEWNNRNRTFKVIRYTSNQVHEDKEAAAAVIRAKRKEYREAAERRKRAEREARETREKMHTKWQWLSEEGRIPNDNAKWKDGDFLNTAYRVCWYGEGYYYCHLDDTHEPANLEELAAAIKRADEEYRQRTGIEDEGCGSFHVGDRVTVEAAGTGTGKDMEGIVTGVIFMGAEYVNVSCAEPAANGQRCVTVNTNLIKI